MPVFAYSARDKSSAIVQGTIDGDSSREARQLLRDQGLQIVEIREQAASRGGFQIPMLGQSQASQHVATFTGELATLLAVGVPLLESLDTLSLQHRGQFRNVILHLKDQVSGGKSMAEAMGQQPRVFDRLCTKMVEVGESTGGLEIVLRQLSEFKRRSSQFKDRVLTALLYPLIVMTVSVGVSIFLMTVVVPNLLTNLIEAGRPLPWPTRILKFGSDVLVAHGWWLAILLVTTVVFVLLFLRTDRGRRYWHRLMMKIPVIGVMGQKQEIARVSLIVSTLMKSGVDFLDAIEIARGTSNNPFLRDSLEQCADQVRSGKDIGHALQATAYFPPMVVQIYTIGQKSGQLDNMLLQLSEDLDSQVESVAARLSTTIEPALILVLSVFVGFILFATLLPILEAGNVL